MGQKVKVVHIITRLDQGGSAENTFLTVSGLDGGRYDVMLLRGLSRESRMGSLEAEVVERRLEEASRRGVRVVTIPDLVRSVSPLRDLRAFVRIWNILRGEKPQIVHTHTSKAGFLGRWAAFLAGVPHIVHTPHGHVFWGYFAPVKTAFFIFLEKVSAFVTRRIITLTDQERKDHLSVGVGRQGKFRTVHSGVRLEGFLRPSVDPAEMRIRLGIPVDALVIGSVGRLIPVKGHIHLVEAVTSVMAERPGALLVFLGEVELRESLQRRASELGILDAVRFLGWRPDVGDVMAAFDIFAFPSLNEGMGKALVEAMAAGKPVVASRVSGTADLVVHGQNGFLVPPERPEALAARLQFLAANPEARRAMGEAGRRMSAAYSAEAMVEKIDRLYGEILEDRGQGLLRAAGVCRGA